MLIELSSWSIKAIILPVFLPLVRFSPSSLIVSPFPRAYLFLPKSPSCLFRTAVLAKKDRPPFKILPLPERKLFFSIRSRLSSDYDFSFILSETMIFFFSFSPRYKYDVEEARATAKVEWKAQAGASAESSTSGGKIPFHPSAFVNECYAGTIV